jgi:hypothetical protein
MLFPSRSVLLAASLTHLPSITALCIPVGANLLTESPRVGVATAAHGFLLLDLGAASLQAAPFSCPAAHG